MPLIARGKMTTDQLLGQPVGMLEGMRERAREREKGEGWGVTCDRLCLHSRDMNMMKYQYSWTLHGTDS